MTLQEIAKEMGMTHQAITNILNNAMRKVRQKLASKRIYEYTDISIGEIFQFAEDHAIHQDKYK